MGVARQSQSAAECGIAYGRAYVTETGGAVKAIKKIVLFYPVAKNEFVI